MHLKSHPKLVRSELCLDAAGVQTSQRSSLFVSQQGTLLKTFSSNHSNGNSRRLPFSVISTKTLRCGNPADGSGNRTTLTSVQLKARARSTLMLRSSQPGCEDGGRGPHLTTMEDDVMDAALMWTVIKPGHVREKIALFASEQRQADGGEGGESGESTVTSSCSAVMMSRATKTKGSWDENSAAKRLCKSVNHQDLRQDPGIPDVNEWQNSAVTLEAEQEEAEPKMSVVEMVAFLEQRANEQQPDCKPVLALQRSSTSIMLSRTTAPEVGEGPDTRGEESEKVRVSEMVAKLELECGRRKEGSLSRTNSLRRTVGRVLLATSDHCFTPAATSAVTSAVMSSTATVESVESIMSSVTSSGAELSSSSLVEAPSWSSQSERERAETLSLTPPSSPVPHVSGSRGGSGDAAPPPRSEEAEPPPGLLFLTLPPVETATHSDRPPPHFKTSVYLEPNRSPASSLSAAPCDFVSPAPCGSVGHSEKKSIEDIEPQEVSGASTNSVAVPLGRSPSASRDFLELRERLRRLLAPPSYLLVLPHHLLVKILALLPTRSLAALKCSCSYFRLIIDTYAVRPADSLWVCDPRYRDDPCKQCKKRYEPGDVSLCRWHHKPYCQALPYGPGYWMCCHGARRDAPGCNVGLHDNRWVPAFHSINVPIYRRSCNHDN
ncbi:F-box only protein 34 [Cololabis saira]|uniref:F-box only protein 34 n=1 Tax=Cololabis saira TaxID=129043 RepID=UPI002AD20D3D|nr:F-box only protein 34 [Cololabis saira]